MALRPVLPGTRVLEAREILALAAGFTLAAAAHLMRLPAWLSALIGMIVLWRLHLARRRLALPNKWLLGLVALAASGGILLEYRTLLGRDAGVALLVVMLALKLLEGRSLRDGMLLGFLGFFLLVTNFLYSQTIATAVYMLFCAWLMIAVIVSLQFTGTWPGWREPARRAILLLVQALPLMLVLFLLFPRIQGPLWGLPHDAYSGLSGLSDNMSPGSLNNLILSDAVAFRAEFRGRIPEAPSLYWRGPVLWDYDGQTWTAPRFVSGADELPDGGPDPVEYTVTLEPHNKRWLFALEMPALRPPRSFITRDMQLLNTTPVRTRMRYEMSSRLQSSHGADEGDAALKRALQLPRGFNPRTSEYAADLRRRFRDDRLLVDFVLARFRNENYVYTLSPPLLGRDAVDEFLFDTRRGFCEHYASAFTVLMRAAGIPARVVTGYQGGQVNPVGDYVLIRQADAHAWAEVWLKDQGWVRIDPTAAIAPNRVENNMASALPASDPIPLMIRPGMSWLRDMRYRWEAVANAWNQWVLGYDTENQRKFLQRLGMNAPDWQTMTGALATLCGAVMLLLTAWTLRQWRRADPVLRAWQRLSHKLRRHGLERHPWEGPRDYAQRVAAAQPQLAGPVGELCALFETLRYGSRPADAAEFRRRVASFKP